MCEKSLKMAPKNKKIENSIFIFSLQGRRGLQPYEIKNMVAIIIVLVLGIIISFFVVLAEKYYIQNMSQSPQPRLAESRYNVDNLTVPRCSASTLSRDSTNNVDDCRYC